MNVSSPTDLWTGSAIRPFSDEKMDQVRDLLFGDYKRQMDMQLAAMDTRLREMESVLSRRLADLEARLEALDSRSGEDRRSAFEDLARNVTELGQRIRDIAR